MLTISSTIFTFTAKFDNVQLLALVLEVNFNRFPIPDSKIEILLMFYIKVNMRIQKLYHRSKGRRILLKTFFPNAPFLYPLEILENLWFSDVFRGIKREHWEQMG